MCGEEDRFLCAGLRCLDLRFTEEDLRRRGDGDLRLLGDGEWRRLGDRLRRREDERRRRFAELDLSRSFDLDRRFGDREDFLSCLGELLRECRSNFLSVSLDFCAGSVLTASGFTDALMLEESALPTSQLLTRSGTTSLVGLLLTGLPDRDRLQKRLLRLDAGSGECDLDRRRSFSFASSLSFFSLANASRIASSWAFRVSLNRSCSACLSLISSFFCSRNLAGMPPMFS